MSLDALLSTLPPVENPKPAAPSPHHVWDELAEAWIDLRDADTLRDGLIVRLAIKRDDLLEGGFLWTDRVVQSDIAVSQPRLLGLFTTDIAGGIPAGGLEWKFANGWKTLYPGDGIAIWNTFQTFMQSLFIAFKVHETAVKNEEEIETLRNYDIEVGWP